MDATVECPNCHYRNPVHVSGCINCGNPRASAASAGRSQGPDARSRGRSSRPGRDRAPGRERAYARDNVLIELLRDWGRLWGWTWQRIEGEVIDIEPVYTERRRAGWGKMWITLGLLAAGLYLAYCHIALLVYALISLFMLSHVLRAVGLRGNPMRCMHDLVALLIGARVGGRGPQRGREVPVRDVRVRVYANHGTRPREARDYLVRIRGEWITGNVTKGDHIDVEGYRRGGTLMFVRGTNTTIHSAIRVRQR